MPIVSVRGAAAEDGALTLLCAREETLPSGTSAREKAESLGAVLLCVMTVPSVGAARAGRQSRSRPAG